MTCEEYRAAFNSWLDRGRSGVLPDEARRHAESCASCAAYAAAMERIDSGLRQVPRVEVPEELLGFADALVQDPRERPGRGRLLAAIRFLAPALVPPLAVWAAGMLLPPGWGGALGFLLATSGLVMFGVASLSPKFSNS